MACAGVFGRILGDLIRREMRVSERHGDLEDTSLAGSALGANLPAVQAHKLVDECQPDSRALVGAGTRALDSVEAFEDARTVSTARPSAARNRTSIAPSRVYLNALETRLRTIFSHMSRST